MYQNIFKLLLVVSLLATFLFSANYVYVFADTPGKTGTSGLENPLGGGTGITDPRVIVGNVIKAGLGLVGSLALVVFILGGFTWVTAAGNEEKVKKGKDMFMWAVFGLAVVFLSYALVTFVIGALTGT